MTTTLARTVAHRLIASLLLSAVTLVGVLAPSPAAGAAGPKSLLETEFLQQLNAERAARGLGALIVDDTLGQASEHWADSMATSGRLVHSNDGRAEIIAYGYRTGQITLAWMQSPSHRHLMVDPNLVYVGVGVSCDSSGRMWAAVQFKRLDTSLPTLSSSSPSPAVTPKTQGSDCQEQAVQPPVRRLYQAFFLRDSDPDGLAYWVGQYQAGYALSGIADQFAGSAEFAGTYGRLSDRDFVRRVYENVMGRSPDRAGYDYWVGQMRAGLTRGELMVAFSESPEFILRSGIS